jgi:Tfp pilus assembly protein PilV
MGILKKKNPPLEYLRQAYKQAPWRIQLQSIGFYLLPVIAIALITVIYLNISAQAATAGLQIRKMRINEETIQRSIANQRTQLAWLTSYVTMHQRAQSMGYTLIDPKNSIFLVVPGYTGRGIVLMAPPPGENMSLALSDSRYQESLWDWFSVTFIDTESQTSGGVQ